MPSRLDPARTLRAQAAALTEVGRSKEAIPLLSQAAGLDPNDPDIKCDLALALMNVERLADADSTMYQAIASAPDHERSYRVRSILLRRGGRGRDALAMAQQAVRLAPENPSTLHVLAQAQLSTKDNRGAWATALRVVELAPESGDSHQLVGQVAIALKTWPNAERACREALRINPTDWAAMNNLGVALNAQGRRVEAVQAYERAAQMNPNAQLPRDNLVNTVMPVQPKAAAVDISRVLLVPWLLPLVLVQWAIRWAGSRRLQRHLSPGAHEYYASRTTRGAIRRMAGWEFGVLVGFLSWIGYSILALVLWMVEDSINSATPASVGPIGLAAAVILAVATGVAFGRRHDRSEH